MLSQKNIKVATAEHGMEALNIIKEVGIGHFDFIFMDNTMPVMVCMPNPPWSIPSHSFSQTGIECTRRLREMGYYNILIGLTGNTFDEELSEFLSAGADLVLSKPLKHGLFDSLLGLFHRDGVRSRFSINQCLRLDDSPEVDSSKRIFWAPRCIASCDIEYVD